MSISTWTAQRLPCDEVNKSPRTPSGGYELVDEHKNLSCAPSRLVSDEAEESAECYSIANKSGVLQLYAR